MQHKCDLYLANIGCYLDLRKEFVPIVEPDDAYDEHCDCGGALLWTGDRTTSLIIFSSFSAPLLFMCSYSCCYIPLPFISATTTSTKLKGKKNENESSNYSEVKIGVSRVQVLKIPYALHVLTAS